MLTLGQTLGLGCIAAVSFAMALDAYQQRWTRSREVVALYSLAAALGLAGVAEFLVSVGWWRIACAIGLAACLLAIAVGMAVIHVEERDR